MEIEGYELAANVSLLFAEHDYLDRFGAARAAGFTAVESWWPFPTADPPTAEVDGLCRAVEQAGVRLVGLNFFAGDMPGGERGVLSDPLRRGEFESSLGVVATVHSRTGCPVFNALYGQRRAGLTSADQAACALANLSAATEALPSSATVVLEALTVGENGDYPLTTCAEVASVLAETGPGVKLLFDTYHLTNNGEDLLACVDRYSAQIGHVQLADSPGRHEPGTGSIDFPAVFRALSANGYRGVVAAEYRPEGATVDGLGWVERS
ncbi:MAG TPA: TIM barrel protein [Pseudonocardiaceae bacterium]|jgi:hydroxypyruvate isomerase|nr:TIM barrel protein [Pseudonocardiaceae bacterium]